MQLYTKILVGMVVGALLGLVLGENSELLPQTGVRITASVPVQTDPGIPGRVAAASGLVDARVTRTPPHTDESGKEWVEIVWSLPPRIAAQLAADGVAVEVGREYRGWVPREKVRRFAPLGRQLVQATEWIGRLFLAMIKMVVVPLVFFSLVVGVASLGDVRKLGRLGGLTLGWFTLTTVIALVIGITLANLIGPGHLVAQSERQVLLASYAADATTAAARAAEAPSLVDQLVGIVPTNPIGALASGDMLAVIFFASILGVAFTLMPPARARPALAVFDSLNEAMVTIVHLVMKLAPFGVAALLFEVVGSTGWSVLLALAAYGGVVLLGLALHVLLAYSPMLTLYAKVGMFRLLIALREALALAFSTSSSSATLPVTKQSCEQNLHLSEEITSFVLPIGATVNMDGTALYQGVAAIFIAQIYGMELSLAAQATIVVSATLASVGAAGVPGAGMITLTMVLTTVGVPAEGVALVLGVDRLLDMFRTTTNVVGDATAAVIVARAHRGPQFMINDGPDSTS